MHTGYAGGIIPSVGIIGFSRALSPFFSGTVDFSTIYKSSKEYPGFGEVWIIMSLSRMAPVLGSVMISCGLWNHGQKERT